MRSAFAAVRPLLFGLLLLTGLLAQTTQWGTPRFHASLRSSNESVYANNLDGTIAIPILSKPGRGKSFYLTRVYNSAIYTSNGAQFQPVGTQPSSSSSLIPYWGWLTQSRPGPWRCNGRAEPVARLRRSDVPTTASHRQSTIRP